MRNIVTCLAVLGLSACNSMVDDMRQNLEGAETIVGPALIQQKLAFDGGCLASIIDNKPLAGLMAEIPEAKSIPPKETRSPTATAAWRIGQQNEVYAMQLPNGACSASVMLGDPQRLYDAALAQVQARRQFTRGHVDRSDDGLAERTTWCTVGAFPYVVVIYKRTTGRRAAFLANTFKAQGAAFSACRPSGQ